MDSSNIIVIHKTSGNLENLCIVKLSKPEQFVLMSLLGVCQEWAVKKGRTWRTLRFLTVDMEDRVILGLRDDYCRPLGTYPASFRPLS